MKNYRFLALPMAMLLIGSAFTGCGSKNDSSAGDSTSTSATDTSREDGGVMSDVETACGILSPMQAMRYVMPAMQRATPSRMQGTLPAI